MPKIQYTWSKVVPGDIISFRYKGKKTVGTLTTLLVLNPKLPNTKKDGTKNFHLVGLKLEERGVIPTIRNKPRLVQIFEKIGSIEVVSGDDEIYRVQIANQDKLGIKPAVYDTLKRELKTFSVYRTYDYEKAR